MKLRDIASTNPIPLYYKVAFLANHFRDPTNRQIEHDLGLTRPEFTILFSLGQREGISAIDIAHLTQLPRNSLSRGVTLLIEKNLITKSVDASDARRSVLKLTPEGNQAYLEILPYLEKQNEIMSSALSESEREQLLALLEKLCISVY